MQFKKITFISLSIISLILQISTISATTTSPNLTDVILYKNGLGYFQIKEKIKDNDKIQIPVKDNQLNDILASIFAIDLNGGRITSIGYKVESDNNILIKLPQDGGLKDLLYQLKGAPVEIVSTDTGKLSGKIIGLDPVDIVLNNKTIQKDYILTILDKDNSLHSTSISSISNFKITDKQLQKDLNKLLDFSLKSKYRNRKIITINTEGKNTRSIILGYLLNTSVWKTSYRIIFNSDTDTEPLILGYAIAENTTENDWNNVNISFIAGAPLSFIMNLSKPVFLNRPNVPVPGLDFLNVNWNKLTGSNSHEAKTAIQKTYNSSIARAAAPMMEMACADEGFNSDSLSGAGYKNILTNSNQSTIKSEKVGEMFVYKVEDKVTIPSGEAAMIPIISEKIKGQRIYYFNESFSNKVSKAFTFTNDSKITFASGPITFFQQNNNLGEGILKETLLPDTKIVIPFSISSEVTLNTQLSTKKSDYIKGKIVNGILRLEYTRTISKKWDIDNKSKTSQTIWIDQPKTRGYNLETPKKADEIVSNCYRFKVSLNSNQLNNFTVKETAIMFDSVYLINTNQNTLLIYADKSYISEKDRQLIKQIAKLSKERSSIQNTVTEMNRQIKSLTSEQKRLRQNVSMLYNSRNTKEQKLKQKWIDKIASAEEQIDKCQSTIIKSNKRLEEIRKEINKLIDKT